MRPLLKFAFLVLSLFLLPPALTAGELAGKKPNIIFIITDDQGYGDLSCHGNPILKTPHIDKLHGRSARFTDFHVSPTCAPTRAALMTGRHEFRSGVTHTINERERLNLQAFTLAQLLKLAGYTTGIFGKWHLGDEPAYQPDQRGFDEVFIHGAGGIGQTYPGSCGDAPGNKYFNPAILHNRKFEKTTGYCTDIFFNQALSWIDARRKDKAPFLAWIATNAPHAPLDCPEEYEKKYTDQVKPNVAKFFGMISNIDDNVGKLMAKLQEWGMDNDTLIIFMTDNGGTAGVSVFNAGMRGQKVTPYQGGTRVPFFFSWPSRVKGGIDIPKLAAHIDVFPTFAELAGVKVPEKIQLDGRSLVPLLENPKAAWPDRYLFTHVGRWAKGQATQSQYAACAVRTARFRLVHAPKAGNEWELFDISSDPGEQKNVLPQHPEAFKDMKAAYDRWWQDIQPGLVNENADGPQFNPFHELYWKQFGGGPGKGKKG
jgi:arylsulfatase A-like enzyme